MEVTLAQMLEAREQRVFRQRSLNARWELPMICFSMNIPGPVKDSALIRRGFYAGCRALEKWLPPSAVKHRQIWEAATGCEAVYVLDMPALDIKRRTTRIEDEHPLGRLFDMDVLGPDLEKLDREAVGGGSRDCIVCGAPGRGCASRRIHSVPQLQAAVWRMLTAYFHRTDAQRIGDLAVQSLLEEVQTTPKPGLVDCRNNGSHQDMDISTFRASAAALSAYFHRCAAIGIENRQENPEETFARLRQAGLEAERDMYRATKGVNTHKGAIFTMGILCGAAGRLWMEDGTWNAAELFREVAAMTGPAMEADWKKSGNTAGYRLYAEKGIRGIRGEAAQGLPSVGGIGLPLFRSLMEAGMDRNRAGVLTLLQLIARVEDTNMISRGGTALAREAARRAGALLAQMPTPEQIEALDEWFIEKNLSPGGCADLLAAVYFVDGLVPQQCNDFQKSGVYLVSPPTI